MTRINATRRFFPNIYNILIIYEVKKLFYFAFISVYLFRKITKIIKGQQLECKLHNYIMYTYIHVIEYGKF